MPARRSVISGIGVVSGLGIGAEPLWQGLLEGRSAIAPVRAFDASSFPLTLAAEIEDGFKVQQFIPKNYRKAAKVMCRDIELALAAAATAVADAGIVTKGSGGGGDDVEVTIPPGRVGCQIGAGLISTDVNEISAAMASAQSDLNDPDSFSLGQWGEVGMTNLTPLWLLKYLPNMLACHVTIVHDCRGPSNTITCAEVSGGLSLGESRRVIERGDADACFTGGAESRINPLGLYRQSMTGMMAETTEVDAERSASIVQPFGTNAMGSVPGEAGCILLLESLENAQSRGARVYAEMIGFGAAQSCDLRNGRLAPGQDGTSLRYAIERALGDAELEGSDIDTIVPMGIGAADYDRAEASALSAVFGERLCEMPLVTTKPNVGQCASAAGAIDIAAGALCVYHQALPARINGDDSMDSVDAGTVAQRDAVLEHVLICGTGLGGQSTAVVLRRMQ